MKPQITRRNFMKNCVIGLVAVAVCSLLSTGNAFGAKEQKKNLSGNILVAYFSHSGNTRYIAEQIHAQVGGDIVEIKTLKPYPKDYDTVVDQAKREQKANYRPELGTTIPNLKSYDVIFIGYPNWWGTMPMALFTFFEKNDFTGKTLIPFCTHEGSYLGRSASDMKALAPRSTILDGLAIRGRSVRNKSTQRDIAAWLAKLNNSKAKINR